MYRIVGAFSLAFVALCLSVTLASCRGKGSDSESGTVQSSGSGPETSSPQSAQAGAKADSKESLSPDEVQAVTGVAYEAANQLANFPNIKHWEYQAGAHLVSLLIATGETGGERMKQGKLSKHRVITDFEEEAIWESIQGKLTARAGERCVEVRISKSHGDEAQRLDHAKALAKLMFERL
ncbi:MAG: hypothetical protein SF339_03465 [Blastocatellia bacterium]|nr:hypothetical protein [Blastocatellia bacterium]